ncbi:hypothetical protein [Gemmata sp.]|uniref:hypothetical protein n=1 Tax=Gemmata sp. TaxID=1914242 RepID=UPI003F70981D
MYEYHGAWWVYYRDDTGPHRKKVAEARDQAEQVAARVNSQLASNKPTLLTFTPIGVADPMPTGGKRLVYVDPASNAVVVIDGIVVWAYRYRAE